VAANPLKWRVSFRIHCAKIKGKKSLKEKEASVKQQIYFQDYVKHKNERTSTVQCCHGYLISYQKGESSREGKPSKGSNQRGLHFHESISSNSGCL
jgi:hypothetical protein